MFSYNNNNNNNNGFIFALILLSKMAINRNACWQENIIKTAFDVQALATQQLLFGVEIILECSLPCFCDIYTRLI